ncbi:MAG: DUF5320 domain-containing protein [Candidatus Woesearchaeota archaeon]
MPGGDGTGPMGTGGWCTTLWEGEQISRPMRRGFSGRGFSRAYARRRFYPVYAEPTKEQEKHYFENQMRVLQEEQKQIGKEIEQIKERLEEMN